MTQFFGLVFLATLKTIFLNSSKYTALLKLKLLLKNDYNELKPGF